MFAFLLRIKRRIKKLLKVQSVTRQKPQLTPRAKAIKLLMLLAVTAFIAFTYPAEDFYDPLDTPRRGDIADRDIIAPFQITLFKDSKEIEEEKERRRLVIPMTVREDTAITLAIYRSFDQYVALIDSIKRSHSDIGTRTAPDVITSVAQRFPLLSQGAIFKSLVSQEDSELLRRRLQRIYSEQIYKVGVVADLTYLGDDATSMISIRRGNWEGLYLREQILDIATANATLLASINRLAAADSVDVEFYYLLGRSFVQPNLFPDQTEYTRRVTEQLSDVSSAREVIEPGELIVRQGRRVSEREERILEEMGRLLRAQAAERNVLALYLPIFSRMALIFVIFCTLYLFLYFFRRDIYRSNTRLLALLMVFVLQMILILVLRRLGWDESVYYYPIAVLPIMVTILFDAEVGMLSTVVLAVLLGVMHRFDFTLVLVTVVVGTVAAITSREVRKRSHYYRIALSIILTYVLLLFLIEQLKLNPTRDMLQLMQFAVLNALVSSLLTIGILPFFESIFSITTDITLLELSDLNHPLLKRLALEAPGTYHHSISVGNLSEAAAKAIHANPLLARVGTYYHDIGKIEIPEYFIENQLGVRSKHEALTPSMSSLILAAHVKRGRVLGEENDIPDDVLNFIEEHHGTMVMTYFYSKAVEQGLDPAQVDKFRYPGPKPQVRETGIAMLADAVEAASRTLDNPKPARIHELIQRIITDRFQSGELDECPLTLRDLARIREAFAQVLIGAFHQRVAYPKKD
ncbi:MAG: HDIG domain-containing protein [bacterium]|nr:HDIG domain-containing protein [bacterium]